MVNLYIQVIGSWATAMSANGRQQEILGFDLLAAGLEKLSQVGSSAEQVQASGRRQEILELKLLAAGLGLGEWAATGNPGIQAIGSWAGQI